MKHWVFYLDGTLVDSLTTHFKVLKVVFENQGVGFSEADHHDVLKVSAKTLPDYFELKFGKEKLESALLHFFELSHAKMESIKGFDGIEKLLQTLQSQGHKLAVWTARDLEASQKLLSSTGLERYFSILVTGSCTEMGKPHPEGLQKIADHFRATTNEMVMIGDFESDMLGAKAFGIPAIRVLWHPEVNKKRCEIAKWQFHNIAEFQLWIEEHKYSLI